MYTSFIRTNVENLVDLRIYKRGKFEESSWGNQYVHLLEKLVTTSHHSTETSRRHSHLNPIKKRELSTNYITIWSHRTSLLVSMFEHPPRDVNYFRNNNNVSDQNQLWLTDFIDSLAWPSVTLYLFVLLFFLFLALLNHLVDKFQTESQLSST